MSEIKDYRRIDPNNIETRPAKCNGDANELIIEQIEYQEDGSMKTKRVTIVLDDVDLAWLHECVQRLMTECVEVLRKRADDIQDQLNSSGGK